MSTVYFRFASADPRDVAESQRRSVLLERLIARAIATHRVTDWRAEAFGAIAPALTHMPAVAAVASRASAIQNPAATTTTTTTATATSPTSAGLGSVGSWACVATPVHLVAGMTNVTLPASGIQSVTRAEAQALADDFNRVFGGERARLSVGCSATLLCTFDRTLEVQTFDPENLLGQDVFAFQARGADAAYLRGLMSEMEMWLYDHAVNRAREANSLATITGLWLWGGGLTLAQMPVVAGWTAGYDPLFSCFGALTEFPADEVGVRAAGVVVIADGPGSISWAEVERRWLMPAVAALQSGHIQRLELSAGHRRFSVDKRFNLRFWRRPRPWWECFDRAGSEAMESNGVD